MQELDHDKTAEEWMFDHQRNPQNIANCIWVCGKLEIMLLNLVQMLDKHVQRLIDRRQYCKMCIGLCQGQAWNQVVKSVLIARRAYRMVG